jgi:hypothetical protein
LDLKSGGQRQKHSDRLEDKLLKKPMLKLVFGSHSFLDFRNKYSGLLILGVLSEWGINIQINLLLVDLKF